MAGQTEAFLHQNFFRQRLLPLIAALLCTLFACLQPAVALPVPRIKPAPPGPVYLSPEDYNTLDLFFEALDDGKWSLVKVHQFDLKDTVAQSVAEWAYLRKAPSDLDFDRAARFLDTHNDWPSRTYIQQIAEKAIEDTDAAARVIAFFQNREPETGNGKLQLARALFETGQTETGITYLKSAWIDHNWSSSKEKLILRNYSQYLTTADHAAKADRQLFEIQATNTRRLLPYLQGSARDMATARIALLRRDGNAATLLRQLSTEEKQDSGVLHAATRYYRRSGQELTAISYARQAPLGEKKLRNVDRWWTEKRLLGRWALKNGFYEDAYAMTAFTGLIDGASFAQAEFEAGWIALRFLNDPARAKPHFAYLNAGVTAPISTARAQYWLGRTFEAAGDLARADQHYLVAAEYPLTYYGQLAYEKVEDRAAAPSFPPVVIASSDDTVIFNSRPMVYAMRILAELDRDREFIIFRQRTGRSVADTGRIRSLRRVYGGGRDGLPFCTRRQGGCETERRCSECLLPPDLCPGRSKRLCRAGPDPWPLTPRERVQPTGIFLSARPRPDAAAAVNSPHYGAQGRYAVSSGEPAG